MVDSSALRNLQDPVKLAKILWPHVDLYDKQRQVLYSIYHNNETYVPGANQTGKDFTLSIALLLFFLTRHPCRVVTTSATDGHLRVLWGEMEQRIHDCAYPLDSKRGGPLVIHHRQIKKIWKGEKCALSYLIGMVAAQENIAAMQGHHIAKTGDNIPRTLFAGDECSSVPSSYHRMASTWADSVVYVGNTWPCENFFKAGIKAGDKPRDPNDLSKGYYRKIIKITAEDSPNIRYARAEQKKGLRPSGRVVVPGVKTWSELQKNLALWDKNQQLVSLYAEFLEGQELLLFPSEWLNYAEEVAQGLVGSGAASRKAKAIGIDPAEGGDKTSMCAVDELGIIELTSKKTPNTAIIPGEALAFMMKHGVPPEKVFFDRGGGGKQHADTLRAQGYPVNTVGFGESLLGPIKYGRVPVRTRKEQQESRYVYLNRRAQMYGMLSDILDPSRNPRGFGIPKDLRGLDSDPSTELRHQLSPIPKRYDGEGRLRLPPKNRKAPDSDEECLVNIIGHSPDEADALVLAVYGMYKRDEGAEAGLIA